MSSKEATQGALKPVDNAAPPASPPAATKALAPIDQMRGLINGLEKEFKAALPPQIPVERFIRTVITTLQMNPNLLQCDRRSVLATCMKAAQDGLLLDGREAAAVPFKSDCQYIPMVAGLLKKMRNSGEITSIAVHCVFEKDHFEFVYGDEEKIIHKPCIDGDNGKKIGVYAIVKTKDGGIFRQFMTRKHVEKVQSVSKAKSGPWFDWEDEQWEKTVLKKIAKRCPSSSDVEQVIAHDNEALGFVQHTIEDGPEPPKQIEGSSFLNAIAEEGTAIVGEIVDPEKDGRE